MKKWLTALFLTFTSIAAFAAGGAHVELRHIDVDLGDKASLQRGAKLYMNYCMGCHGLEYARYERTADDLGIPHDLYAENLIFDSSAKIGTLMKSSMPKADAEKWFGAAPPDLTLIARRRGPDWLYTYLTTFYADASRPWGVNNKVFKDVGMPHVLLELQGLQECAPGPVKAKNGGVKEDPVTGEPALYDEDGHALNPCGSFKIIEEGTMSPDEFDTAMLDLTGFLEYIGEPMAEQRKRIGYYVLFFLGLLLVPVYLLNREYWKDVH